MGAVYKKQSWWTTTSLIYCQTSLSRPHLNWEQNFWDTQGSRYQGKNSIFKNESGFSIQYIQAIWNISVHNMEVQLYLQWIK